MAFKGLFYIANAADNARFMEFIETDLPGVIRVRPRIFSDSRGSFREQFRADVMSAAGIRTDFVQDNVSVSAKHVLRGLHYQIGRPQAKLVGVMKGAVLDVAVDIRPNSPCFGKHVSVHLDDVSGEMLYIPEGFAHGFLTLEEDTIFHYKCSDYYFPAGDRGIAWNDPALGIKWSVLKPVLSEKDCLHPLLDTLSAQDLP